MKRAHAWHAAAALLLALASAGQLSTAQAASDSFGQLNAAVERVALNKEVLVCVADAAWSTLPALRLWMNGTRQHVKNSLLVALDDQVAELAKQLNYPYFRLQYTGNAKAAKFSVIKDILSMGISTLVTDAYTITLKDPFSKLVRDSDIEALSDGTDRATSDGVTEVLQGSDSKSGQLMFRIPLLNPGLFYARANENTVHFMERMVEKLAKTHVSEQVAFHELAMKPSSADYQSAKVSVRVVDGNEYVNVKTLLKAIRRAPDFSPVMVHMAHAADKTDIMIALWSRFVDSNQGGLDHMYKRGSGAVHHDLAPILRDLEMAGLGELRNPQFVRSLVERAGLFYDDRNPYGSDNRFMRPKPEGTSKGGGLWQCPIQVATMMVYLSRLGIRSMLEIGTASGWTTTLLAAYLRRFGLEVLQTVDLDWETLLDMQLPETWHAYDLAITRSLINGQGVITPPLLPTFDLVFIDGDHSYKGVSSDWARYGPMARRAVMFHDVGDFYCTDVRRFWAEVKAINSKNTSIHEFTLRGAPEDEKEKPLMGFGVLELIGPDRP